MAWPRFESPRYGQARSWLKRVTYKPGTRLGLVEHLGMFSLELYVTVADVNNDGKPLELKFVKTFPEHMVEELESFTFCLRELTRGWEEHERMEWLRMDGRSVDDPHPELGYSVSFNHTTASDSIDLKFLAPERSPTTASSYEHRLRFFDSTLLDKLLEPKRPAWYLAGLNIEGA